jgi:hypothetical protein
MSPYANEPKHVCRSCQKPLLRLPISRVFPAYHARCIERAVAIARAETRGD